MIVSNYAIKFRTAVFVLVAGLIVAGSFGYMRLPREGAPDITVPYVFVNAFYEGTSPAEMERLVAIPLEKQFDDLDNLEEIRTVCTEGLCAITVEFEAGGDIELAKQSVKDKVDLARPDLPQDLDEPLVDAFNFSSDFPVLTFAVSGNAGQDRLKNVAENLRDEIELLAGVKQVSIAGILDREIRVTVDPVRLSAYEIPLSLLIQRIGMENATFSAGNITAGDSKFQIRLPGEFVRVSEIEAIPIMCPDGRIVHVRDVASVGDTFKDRATLSRINGKPCVSVLLATRSPLM